MGGGGGGTVVWWAMVCWDMSTSCLVGHVRTPVAPSSCEVIVVVGRVWQSHETTGTVRTCQCSPCHHQRVPLWVVDLVTDRQVVVQ